MIFSPVLAFLLLDFGVSAGQIVSDQSQLHGNHESKENHQGKKEKQSGKVDYSKAWDQTIEVPDDVEVLGEKCLPYIPPTLVQMKPEDDQYGWRSFGVIIKPGQTFRATLEATPIASYFMNFSLPKDENNPLFSKLKDAKNTQTSFRRHYIEFTNTLDIPYPLVFYVLGLEENPYSIKLTRS